MGIRIFWYRVATLTRFLQMDARFTLIIEKFRRFCLQTNNIFRWK